MLLPGIGNKQYELYINYDTKSLAKLLHCIQRAKTSAFVNFLRLKSRLLTD